MKKLFFYIAKIAMLISLTSSVRAAEPIISIDQHQLIVNGHSIPSECLAQLQTRLNGDNTIAALYLIHPEYRGCSNANIPYPEGNADKISTELRRGKSPNVFLVKVCSVIDGSMGSYCDYPVIEIRSESYKSLSIHALAVIAIKLGEWNE